MRRKNMPEATPALEVTRKSMTRVDLLTVAGRVDAATAPLLDRQIKESFAAGRHRLVIDFGPTDFISSAGLKVLISALKEAKRHRGDVRLAKLSDRLKETLSLVGLIPALFKVYDDLVDAVGSF